MNHLNFEYLDESIRNSGLTAREIAERLQVSECSIHLWRYGKMDIMARNVRGLVKVLKLDINILFKL